MKKKYLFILLLAMFAALSGKAQNNISVASFQLAEFDLTANTHGTQVLDQNGHTCALIKVETTQTGFAFDVGMMGITKVEQHTGEIWVYVPYGVKHITIQHQQLGTLRDYYFPCPIQEARTYIMQLTTGNVKTIVEEDLGGSYLMMTVKPKTAQVYVDDKPKTVENGEVKLLLSYGRHTYRVESPNYMTEAGAIEIGHERKELNISLTSARATLTVNCTDAEADIYINEEKKGRGSWTGQLDEGMYAVEARKAGHRTVKQSLTLAKQEQKALTLNAPQPVYGKLNLDSSPGNCEVYLDGTKIGKSPDVFSNILVGNHTVELRKNGYESQSRQISIEENKITDFEMTLQLVGAVAQQPEVQQTEPTPQPKQNEKPVQKDKWKTFIMANVAGYYDFLYEGNEGNVLYDKSNLTFGLTFGQVKKIGYYISFSTNFRDNNGFFIHDDRFGDWSLDVERHLYNFTAGAVFRCTKSSYLYAGTGYSKSTVTAATESYYDDHYKFKYSGWAIEAGAMLHIRRFSLSAGIDLFRLKLKNDQYYDVSIFKYPSIKIGLGYNF